MSALSQSQYICVCFSTYVHMYISLFSCDLIYKTFFFLFQRIHCGCIASKSMFEYLDYGGIGCTTCVKRSRLDVVRLVSELANF